MPRGWHPKPTEAERLARIAVDTTKIIKKAMVDCGIEYNRDLALMIGMVPQTLSAKFKSGSWSQQDLCRIVSVLKIQPESALKMLGLTMTPKKLGE